MTGQINGRISSDDGLQCVFARNALGSYCIPESSKFRHCAQTVLGGRIFEPRTIEFIVDHAGSGDIIHAGTFFGDFLPSLSRGCRNGAKVWGFEPNPENFACASVTRLLNDLHNVELIDAGLGGTPSTAALVTRDAEGRGLGEVSFIAEKTESNAERSEEIRIATIDQTIPSDREISVIHLDIEGYEQTALSGALTTIRRCRPILILETMPDEDWLTQHLYGLGYSIQRGVHGNIVLSVDTVADRAQYRNLMLRNFLKRTIPYRIRRTFRDIQANRQASRAAFSDTQEAIDINDLGEKGEAVQTTALNYFDREENTPSRILILGSRNGSILNTLPKHIASDVSITVVEPTPRHERYARIAAIVKKYQTIEFRRQDVSASRSGQDLVKPDVILLGEAEYRLDPALLSANPPVVICCALSRDNENILGAAGYQQLGSNPEFWTAHG